MSKRRKNDYMKLAARHDVQRGLCYLCGSPILEQRGRPGAIRGYSIDHVWPRFLEGKDDNHNKLWAHFGCNSRKGSRPPRACEAFFLRVVNAIVLGVRL